MNVLVVYGTSYGQTAKIANVIGRTLRETGHTARVVDGQSLPQDLLLEPFDAIIVGASLQNGRYQQYISDFVRTHLPRLRTLPSAFFSVSLAEADPRERADVQQALERFSTETGWRPDRTASFAGSAAELRRYRRTRVFLRRMPARHGGQAVDEYTDWDAVNTFTREFVRLAEGAVVTAA